MADMDPEEEPGLLSDETMDEAAPLDEVILGAPSDLVSSGDASWVGLGRSLPLADAFPGDVGICATCVNVRRVESRRGSVFLLCVLSAADPRYPRYPGLPIQMCEGWMALIAED
ncbi:MAG: hypothetical protein LBG44_00640 [Gemmatimonadota bacterium]|jgi:hypothetical protein|nr:hypothetical protein [Gemmatimonadota bacterium]